VLTLYPACTKSAVGILKDSFSKTQTIEQWSLMRNLGTLAVAVGVGAVPVSRALTKYQILPTPTGTRKEALSFVSTLVKFQDRLRGVLETSAVFSHLEGTG
jgi:hypothetical protein